MSTTFWGLATRAVSGAGPNGSARQGHVVGGGWRTADDADQTEWIASENPWIARSHAKTPRAPTPAEVAASLRVEVGEFESPTARRPVPEPDRPPRVLECAASPSAGAAALCPARSWEATGGNQPRQRQHSHPAHRRPSPRSGGSPRIRPSPTNGLARGRARGTWSCALGAAALCPARSWKQPAEISPDKGSIRIPLTGDLAPGRAGPLGSVRAGLRQRDRSSVD
jgi:hypothetical protein